MAAVSISNPKYSFVIPVYNEEKAIQELFVQLAPHLDRLDGTAEVILINDGSSDGSLAAMLACMRRDARYKIIDLARNFGQQLAITAGLDVAAGDAVIIMDADLQDSPQCIHDLINKWKEGNEVVCTVRSDRSADSLFKRWAAGLFYRLMRRLSAVDMPVDSGDFRLVDRSALTAFRAMREHSRYLRGMFCWVGFRQASVPVIRARRVAGETKYTLGKMARLAADAVISFSDIPLTIALRLGFLIACLAALAGMIFVILRFTNVYLVRGWTSLMIVSVFFGGVQLMMLGVIGAYISRIFREVQGRPLYIVKSTYGFERPPMLPQGAVIIQTSRGEHGLFHG